MKAKPWWAMPPGKEREAAKAASAPKPPEWQRVKGPLAGTIRREATAWISSYRRCKFTPGNRAGEQWALAQVMAPTACPVAVTVGMEGECLRIEYGEKTYFLPPSLIGSPSDVDFVIRQILYAVRNK